MALTRLPGFIIDSTSSFTFAQATVTGNVFASNINANGVINFIGASNVSLGPISNIKVTGGSTGQYLQTDGTGNLSWSTVAAGGGSSISNGTSNVDISTANGNITLSASGNANVLVVTGTGANITGTLNATGNLTAGNITTGSGSGGNITGGNLVSANFLTGTLTTAAQPNITSVGSLSNLISNGIINFTNASNVSLGAVGNVKVTGGTNGQYLITDGAGNLSFTTLSVSTSSISNGNSNVNIPSANGNVNISSAGNANIVVVTGTGVNVAGNVAATGNISAGNITTGSGSGGNLLGANFVIANFFTGTLTTSAQPNITSVGTLGNLTVTGTTTSGNFATAGNITASFLVSNIATGTAPLTVTSTTRVSNLNVAQANVADFISVTTATSGNAFLLFANAVTGNIAETANTVFVANSSNGALHATTFVGALSGAATTAGTVTTNAQPNITSVGNLTALTVTGNIDAGNIISNGGAGGSITGANLISANFFTGVITTNAQPNITSIGTLGNLTVTSNIAAGNLLTDNLRYANGTPYVFSSNAAGANTQVQFNNANAFSGSANFTFNNTNNTLSVTNIIANGAGLTSITGANVTGTVPNATTATTAGTVTANAQPNITSVGNLTALTVTGNADVGALTTGNITAGTGTGGNITGANLVSANFITGELTTAAQPNITSVGTLTSLAVTGNLSSGNANLGNAARANFFIGDGSLLTNIPIGTSLSNGNSNVSIPTANGNILVSVAGTSNIASFSNIGFSVGLGSLTRAPNVAANSPLYVVSNVTASDPPITIQNRGATGYSSMDIYNSSNVFMGAVGAANPSATTVAPLANLAYIYGAAGASGVGVYATTGNVTISANSNANIVTVTGTGANITGTANITGNLTAANANLGNLASANFGAFGGAITGPRQILQAKSTVAGNVPIGIQHTDASSYVAINFYNNSDTAAAAFGFANPSTTLYANTMYMWSNTGIAFSGNGFSATGGTRNMFINSSGIVTIPTGVAASNTTTGAFVVTGGMGVSGNIHAGNVIATTFVGALSGAATTAGTVTTAAQPNITSVGTLSNLTSNGTINFTGASNVSLGAVGNVKVTGGSNGQYLQTDGTGNLAWSNVAAGGGSSISNGTSNVNIATANGNVTLAVAGSNIITVSNIGFAVTGKSNLGPASNVIITGGTTGYMLSTDGTGNLSWEEPAQPASVIVDSFTGNGVQTTFTLSTAPSNIYLTTVNYNGATLLRSSYSVSGSNVVFSEAPAAGYAFEVTTVGLTTGGSAGPGGTEFYNTRTYTGNGVQTVFTVTSGSTSNSVIVTENGIVQTPGTDYAVSGNMLTFTTAPDAAVSIQIRELSIGGGGATGAGGDQVFYENDQTVTASYAISAGKSAMTAGPVTIEDGVVITVPSGSRWVIL